MGRRRWGAATDTGDPLSLVQVLLSVKLSSSGEIRRDSSDGVLRLFPTFCFFAAVESSLVITIHLTGPIWTAPAVFVQAFIRRPSVCLPSFAFSPNVSKQQRERGGAEGTAPSQCPHPPLDNLLSILLAAVSTPHPPPPPPPTVEAHPQKPCGCHHTSSS